MTYSQGYGLQQDLISRTSVPIFQLAFPSLISPLVHPALGPFTKSMAPMMMRQVISLQGVKAYGICINF